MTRQPKRPMGTTEVARFTIRSGRLVGLIYRWQDGTLGYRTDSGGGQIIDSDAIHASALLLGRLRVDYPSVRLHTTEATR